MRFDTALLLVTLQVFSLVIAVSRFPPPDIQAQENALLKESLYLQNSLPYLCIHRVMAGQLIESTFQSAENKTRSQGQHTTSRSSSVAVTMMQSL